MRLLLSLIAVPAIVVAQTSFPTEWPSGAETLAPEALRQRLTGKTFIAKSLTSPEIRIEFREAFAYLNIGSTSDSGRWRTEGSSVCNEWRNLRHACSEYRALGEALYVKRANNGEIMLLLPQ